eukprot:gnl/TRDRNA2_/TRDRNA2_42418_c0_seq1.p1 gnl/TRDRNA2_/TRDRNA2_42418_c0~~gnl/TRDRNA2_/TRDRNA2_42418_c0_seq1.p1  ORF type:complete len:345 (+),score=75.09 gnl/TRDRNA2_/TRDRNA2_42418_c0_seq1:111-1145(+)
MLATCTAPMIVVLVLFFLVTEVETLAELALHTTGEKWMLGDDTTRQTPGPRARWLCGSAAPATQPLRISPVDASSSPCCAIGRRLKGGKNLDVKEGTSQQKKARKRKEASKALDDANVDEGIKKKKKAKVEKESTAQEGRKNKQANLEMTNFQQFWRKTREKKDDNNANKVVACEAKEATTTEQPREKDKKMKNAQEDSWEDEEPKSRFRGRIRNYSEQNGFGFISCPETYKLYGRDVFFHRSQMFYMKMGTEVTFVVQVNKKGMPQARSLKKADRRKPENVTDSCNNCEELEQQLQHTPAEFCPEVTVFGVAVMGLFIGSRLTFSLLCHLGSSWSRDQWLVKL